MDQAVLSDSKQVGITQVKIILSLAIPFYNEEPNVQSVLKDLVSELDSEGISFEILAVDNGSCDATQKRIQEMHEQDPRIKPVTIAKNLGYGHGILEGLRHAQGEIIGYAWGDGQVIARDVRKIFRTLVDSGADLSKAHRVKRHDGLFRLIQTRLYAICFLFLFGPGFKDPNGCPKLFRRGLYERAGFTSTDWLLDPEILIKARLQGARIVNVPVVFNKRKRGISKVRWFTSLGFFLGLLKLRLWLWRQ